MLKTMLTPQVTIIIFHHMKNIIKKIQKYGRIRTKHIG